MTDAEIDTSDIPPLTSEFFARAVLRMPHEPQPTLGCLELEAEDYPARNHNDKLLNSPSTII